MNCHSQVQKDNPKLEPVRESWKTGKPIEWVQLHRTPDYVFYNHAAHVNRGLAYLSLKEFPKAIADFDQAIRSTPKDASLYFKRGVAESGSGNWAAAVKSYSEAIRLNPKYSDAYGNRSLAYRRIGDTAKSQADAEKSQQLKADADRAKQSASAR